MEGFIPVSYYPRFDFLLCACDQLVNHLDKIPEMGNEPFRPQVILRVVVGGKRPLDAGPQHTGDYTEAFRRLLRNITVDDLLESSAIVPAYQRALARKGASTLIIERAELY